MTKVNHSNHDFFCNIVDLNKVNLKIKNNAFHL